MVISIALRLLVLTLVGATHMPPTATWPISPVRVEAGFAPGANVWNAGHRGIDLSANPGTLVRSPVSGVVRFAGMVVDREVLSITAADGTVFTLEPVHASVSAGDRVEASSALGEVASGGHCDSHCVHLGVIVDGEYRSPWGWFAHPWARLKPL